MSTLTPVTFQTKSLADTVTLASGDVKVRGYLTRWDDLDSEGDRMLRGSFLAAIPTFLRGTAALCWEHDKTKVIGKVLSLAEDETGVLMEAVLWKPSPGSILQPMYDAVKRLGKIGASVGAFLERRGMPDGTKGITGVRITEASLTPRPALASAGVEVVEEGKALGWGWTKPEDDLAWARRRMHERRAAHALAEELRGLSADLSKLTRR